MSDPHWESLKEIFHAAIALPVQERPAYLDRACDSDTELRRAVESLLKSHEETGFVDQPAYHTLQLKPASERSSAPDRIVPAAADAQEDVSKSGTSAASTQTASSAEYIVNQVRSHKRAVLLSLALLLLIAGGMFIYAWRSRETDAPSHPEIKSLAVLPLENLSGDASQEYFADGMTEALSDILKLQSDVAQAIAAEISVQLTPAEQNRLASTRPINPKAHEAYLLGRYHVAKLNPSDLSRAVDYFQEAIRIEPDFVAAYAGLSRAWSERGVWRAKTYIEVESPAREAARKALPIDPANSSAHTSMCMILINYDHNYSAAEEEVKRAIEIDPGSADAYVAYGWLLQVLGRHDEVRQQMEKAEQLDPASSQIQSDFGRMLYRARKYEEAEKHLWRSIELDPNNYGSYGRLGDVYIEMGRFGDATAMFEKSRAFSRKARTRVRLAVVHARMGNRQAAVDALTTTSNRSAWELGRLYAALGEPDRAFSILNESLDKHDGLLTNLKDDPGFESLHSDPRWKLILRRLNFPDD